MNSLCSWREEGDLLIIYCLQKQDSLFSIDRFISLHVTRCRAVNQALTCTAYDRPTVRYNYYLISEPGEIRLVLSTFSHLSSLSDLNINTQAILAPLTTNMIHFTTFFALMVGGMEVIQPAAAGVLAGFSPGMQRRQGSAPPVPPQCATICDPVNNIISNVGGANF